VSSCRHLNTSRLIRWVYCSAVATLLATATLPAEAQTQADQKRAYPIRPTIFGRPLRFQGFHFHASLGAGVGPDIAGLYHAMELGYSFSGYSVSLLHTFLQNKGVIGGDTDGPDEIGGFLIQVRGPLYFEDLSWKLASGVGGTVDQSDGFHANPGFGVHYGVDLHFPIWARFGPTLSLDGMNVFSQGHHYFGAGLALGVSVF
jgi:hypothetical protein